jgi:hypothetical protein
MRLPFTIPQRSEEFAEFCGIMLGDGGISEYQTIITLHSEDDSDYSEFVTDLIEKLFAVSPGIYKKKTAHALDLVISRVGLVEFLTRDCGLKLGNKVAQACDVPDWIKENVDLSIACVRGLVDTDGSIFTHRYISKGKEYAYKKLSFTSVSKPLLDSVQRILREFGLNARLGSNHDIRLDSKDDMAKYFDVIGSHNPKHLNRYAS